ncbi:MAG: hypothetical protein QNJ84_17525 [Alphaproteobacteria bacterium]|nr:hypothetical protein [Alphaproteobacteria bacterium]
MTEAETKPNVGAPPRRNIFGQFHNWLAASEDWFIGRWGSVLRPVLITWTVGGLVWALTDSRGMAAYGLVFAGAFELYRSEARGTVLSPTLGTLAMALGGVALAMLYVLWSPWLWGAALFWMESGWLGLDFPTLSLIADLTALTVMAGLLSLLGVSAGLARGRFLAGRWKLGKLRLLVTAILILIGIFWASLMVDACVHRSTGCDDIKLRSMIYVLNDPYWPKGVEAWFFTQATPAAMGNPARFERIQVLFENPYRQFVAFILPLFAIAFLVSAWRQVGEATPDARSSVRPPKSGISRREFIGWAVFVLIVSGGLYVSRFGLYSLYFIETMEHRFAVGEDAGAMTDWLERHGFAIRYDHSSNEHSISIGSLGQRNSWTKATRRREAERRTTGQLLNNAYKLVKVSPTFGEQKWISNSYWVSWEESEFGEITELYFASYIYDLK